MGLSLIVKQILGEIDNAAEALENKLNCNVLLLAFQKRCNGRCGRCARKLCWQGV